MDPYAAHFIDAEPRRDLGHALGVQFAGTRGWWLFPVSLLFFGQILALLFGSAQRWMVRGLGYSLSIAAAVGVHFLGHLVAARLVDAPMDTFLVTPMRPYTLYDDTSKQLSRRQNLGRAIGGPVASLGAGLLALAIAASTGNYTLRPFGIASLLIGIFALVPILGNDGMALFLGRYGPA